MLRLFPKWSIFIPFFCLAFICGQVTLVAQSVEICDNGIDDDGDGLIDINDNDCDCPIELPTSLIPNPSFEDRTGCPTSENQLELAVPWQQASAATTDYMNTCGNFLSHPVFIDPVPLPMPDGTGCIGFRNGRPNDPRFKEYTGACLSQPMEQDVLYTLNMWVGFMNATDSPAFELTVYGADGCQLNGVLPFGNGSPNIGCPLNVPGYEQLGSSVVAGVSEWVNTNITFRPTRDLDVIVIGANCQDNPFNHYYFFDNLILQKTVEFGEPPNITGHPCMQNVSLDLEPISGDTYQWYKDGIAILGETNSAYTIPSEQTDIATFQLMITSEDVGCALSDPYVFEIPEILTTNAITLCDNEPIPLAEENLIDEGIYSELFITPNNCDSTVITIVTVNPSAETFLDETICAQEEYILGAQVLNESGTYVELFRTVQDCDSVVTLNLTVLPSLISVDAQGDRTIRLGEQTPILADITNVDDLLTFYWISNDSLATICDTCLFQLVSPTETTSYSLRAIDVAGCEAIDNVIIQVEQFYDVYFPNAFSPNRDGFNDFYFVHGTSNVSQVLSLDIYDRWGNHVYNGQNFPVNSEASGWGGTYRQQEASAGVYVYVSLVEFVDGNVEMFKGDIVLNR